VAICFKQNFLIGAIAIAIYWILHAFKSKSWKDVIKPVAALLALLLLMSVPTSLISGYFEKKTGIEAGEGTPSILWIAMGTDMDNTVRAPGWYNGFNYSTFTNSNYDSEESAKIGWEKVKENIEEMKADPDRALNFFRDKTVSQWCEPMFQSVWSGPLEACKQYTKTELLQSVYNGGEVEYRIENLSKLLLLVVFGFTLIFLLLYRKKFEGWELFTLFFVGGLIFHTFWEGKSQYTYPYVFCLIPFAAYAFYAMSEKFEAKGRALFGKKKAEPEAFSCESDENVDDNGHSLPSNEISESPVEGEVKEN
jgi:hypothetical protein